MEQSCVEVRISGRVQGVGYRYFAQEKALAANLVGWIRNRADGDVEGQAQGRREALEQWIVDLKKGPSLGRVEAVSATWRTPDLPDRDFYIK